MINRAVACGASGVLGIALGALTIGWPATVDEDVWSYPFSFRAGLVIGAVLAVVHLLTLCGYLAVRELARRRAVRTGVRAAVAGLALLAAAEIVGGAIGKQHTDSAAVGIVGMLFGLASLLVAAGSIAAGLSLVRTSGENGSAVGWPVLLSGITLLVLVTPANIAGDLGFRMAALMLWSACFVALGAALVRPVRDQQAFVVAG